MDLRSWTGLDSLLISPTPLLQATKDLENYDAAHHEEFKRYEMLKEHERREYLRSLDEEKRREEEARFQELRRRHREHPKVNVPVRTPSPAASAPPLPTLEGMGGGVGYVLSFLGGSAWVMG